MTVKFALRGQTLAFKADPFAVDPEDALAFDSDGAVVICDGLIEATGPAHEILARYPGIAVEAYPDHLITSGFVDAHIHYPQTGIIASYGAQLMEWLQKYTFPEELKFSDPDYARSIAETFLDEILRNGTTTASVYCTVHPQSVDALFEAATGRGLRMAAGKSMMDRNAPPGLTDTPQRAYDESEALIERWHGRDRSTYVVTPRFSVTSSDAQMEAMGALWKAHPTTLMQTHISENLAEIKSVAALFPTARDYLDTYERVGLIGPGANFGHAIHLGPREIDRLRDTGSGISHCPTSNFFIGSGLFDLAGLRQSANPIPVGLGTDVGGGSSFSMLATMRAAYEIAQLRGNSLHPARAFWLATQGSARVLRMHDRIGNLTAGFDADIAVLDLNSTPLIAQRMARTNSISEALFVQIILGDDRAIAATYAGGRLLHRRDKENSGGQTAGVQPPG
jgi:guanine deaminase